MNRTKPIIVKKNLLLSLMLSIFTLPAFAQDTWEAGGMLGIAYYFGDLNTTFRLDDPSFAAGVAARYNFNNRLAFKFSGNYTTLSASDADSKNTFEQARNLSFRSAIFDGAAQLEFNFLPYVHGSKEKFYTPYIFGGFNIFSYNPQAELNNEWIDLRSLGTEGQFFGEEYSTVSGGLVYGVGFKIDLSYEWSINFEISGRQLFTDYVDDVSTTYPDMEDLEKLRGELAVTLSDRSIPGLTETPIGQPGRQRGNSRDNDNFTFISFSLMYYFGDLKCPTYGN